MIRNPRTGTYSLPGQVIAKRRSAPVVIRTEEEATKKERVAEMNDELLVQGTNTEKSETSEPFQITFDTPLDVAVQCEPEVIEGPPPPLVDNLVPRKRRKGRKG